MQATSNWTSSSGDTFARLFALKNTSVWQLFCHFCYLRIPPKVFLNIIRPPFLPETPDTQAINIKSLITYLPVLFWSYNHRFLQVYDLSENVERLSLVPGIHRGWSWTLLLVDHADTSSRMDCAWQVPFFLHHFIDCCIGYVLEKTARGVALRSFSITRNSQGPSLVPCGTPGRTERHSEKQSFPSFWLFAACWRQRQQANLWFKD